MGEALATHCCASDEEEKPEVLKNLKKAGIKSFSFTAAIRAPLPWAEDVAFVSVSLDKQPLTETLQGNWYRQCDSRHVGSSSA